MALTGNIESFPVAEVLRLAARSRQSGILRVEAGGVQGRIYFSGGQLTYATLREDDSLSDDLAAAGLIDPHLWYPVERGEAPIESALSKDSGAEALRAFLADRIADVLVRIMRPRHGRFDFTDGAAGRYELGEGFPVEETLLGVERRVAEWALIEAIIPSVNAKVALAPHLGERAEVSIDAETWRILAAVSGRSTIWSVADTCHLSEFAAAKAMADLVRMGLVVVTNEDELELQSRAATMVDLPGQPEPAPHPGGAATTQPESGPDDTVIDFVARAEANRSVQGW